MAIQRITKAASTPTGGARIKIVSGPNKDTNAVTLPDTPYDPSDANDARVVSKTTGYFGKTIAEIE
jgi:hypothetical protein